MTMEQTFGDWLKSRRRQLDITQQELADSIGCSEGTIRKIESNSRKPSKQLAELMASVLKVPLEQQDNFITFSRTDGFPIDMSAIPRLPSQADLIPDRSAETIPHPNQTSPTLDVNGVTLEFDKLIAAASIPDYLEQEAFEPLEIVARENEIDRLTELLDFSVEGKGSFILISGEAGAGKSFLLEAFSEQAQHEYPELVVAGGACTVYTGIGDPYLPFRSIFSMLLGNFSASWSSGSITASQAGQIWRCIPNCVEILVEDTPELIEIIVGRTFVEKQLAAYARSKPEEMNALQALYARLKSINIRPQTDQNRIFEGVTRFFERLAEIQPLVLIFDDLHWVDLSSLSLLNFLSRRLVNQPVFLIGAFRPEDVIQGRNGDVHPLQIMLTEWRRKMGEITISLDEQHTAEEFVDALLNSRPNQLPASFRKELANLTGGHPLFTVEVLHDLEEKGILTSNQDGYLIQTDVEWETLPARVEGVIARRIDRLDEDLRELLLIASVEGERFTAEVVATVQSDSISKVVRRISKELERLHQLVRNQGVRRIGRQSQSTYLFRHNLFQKYIYEQLSPAERMFYHEDVGQALEALYVSEEDIAVPAVHLARHFEEAQQYEKAARYMLIAGRGAADMTAFDEAMAYFKRGLNLVIELPSSSELDTLEVEFMHDIGRIYWYLGAPEKMFSTYLEAIDLATKLDKPEHLAEIALSYEASRRLMSLDGRQSEINLRKALAAIGDEESALRVRVIVNLSRTLEATHKPEELREMVENALQIARRVDDPLAISDALKQCVQIDRRPETIDKRIAYNEELLALNLGIGDLERILDAYSGYIPYFLEGGYIDIAKEKRYAFEEGAAELQLPFFIYVADVYKTALHILEGNFNEAEVVANRIGDLAQEIGMAELDGLLGIHMFTIRWQQGRLKEIAPLIKMLVAGNPASATWRPGLALIYAVIDEKDQARDLFNTLASNRFAAVPRDSMWPTSLSYLAEVCHYLENGNQAEILYDLLLPYKGHMIIVGAGVACYGAADRYLGMLAAIQSEWEVAAKHFEDAIAFEIKTDAQPWLAHSRYHFGAMLLSQGDSDKRSQANEMLDLALETAQSLGMAGLVQKVEALQTS